MARTAGEIIRVLRRLRPLIRTGVDCGDAVPNWQRGFGPEGLKYCLIGDGWPIYQELEDLCEAIAEEADVVGPKGATDIASDLLFEIARDPHQTEDALGKSGFTRLADPPPERIVLQPIYGMALLGTIDVCAIALRPFDPERLAAEFADERGRDFMTRQLQEHRDRAGGVYAVARVAADAERAFAFARLRAGCAFVLSLLSRDPPDQHWWMEWSAAFVPASTFSRLSFTADGSTESLDTVIGARVWLR
jgi:hypothetical protein